MCDKNYIAISKFIEEYKDTLVLDFNNVVILRGFVDGEDDYYWLLQKMDGEFYQLSCVGDVIPLKTYIPNVSYQRLRNIFKCNLDKINLEIK